MYTQVLDKSEKKIKEILCKLLAKMSFQKNGHSWINIVSLTKVFGLQLKIPGYTFIYCHKYS